MGNWGNIYYINCSDQQKIITAIEKLFATENKTRINRPAQRTIDNSRYNEPMQYGNSYENELWGMVLVGSTTGWTAIQTAPFELLCEKNSVTGKYRFSELAIELQTECLYMGLYDGTSAILVEATADGTYKVSGYREKAGSLDFNGYKINEDNFILHLQVLQAGSFQDLPNNHPEHYELVKMLLDFEQKEPLDIPYENLAEAMGKFLCGNDFNHWHNSLNIEYLIPHKELKDPGYTEVYFSFNPASGKI